MKLHAALAIERDAERRAKAITEETVKSFARASQLFMGKTRTLTMFDEERSHENTSESSTRTTTVMERLNYMFSEMADYWNLVAAKEIGNQAAAAAIQLPGFPATPLPATYLLGLETKLNQLRGILLEAPTLEAGVNWEETDREDVFRASLPDAFKTQKTYEILMATPATKEHKAQYEKVTIDKNVGRYETSVEAGMLTSGQKAAILKRLDTLLAAVKVARQKANDTEIEQQDIAKSLFDYILKG